FCLAATYGIVKQSGGYFSVVNSAGGLTVHIYLPAAQNWFLGLSPPASDSLRTTGSVVVFEPEEGMRHLMRNLLTRKGYSVLEAESEDRLRRILEQSAATVGLLIV